MMTMLHFSTSTSNRMTSSAINDKFDKWFIVNCTRKYVITVNHQPIPIAIQKFKSISLEQICYKRSQSILVLVVDLKVFTPLHCLLFPKSKNENESRKVLPM